MKFFLGRVYVKILTFEVKIYFWLVYISCYLQEFCVKIWRKKGIKVTEKAARNI